MNIIEKLKLAFKARKPASKLIDQAKEIKRGWKKVSFWVSVTGTLTSLAGALTGIIPGNVSIIINTILTAFYNVLRGLDKASEVGVRPPLQSTEFWQGVLGEASNVLVALKTGGVDPALLHSCEIGIAAIMAIFQNIGASQPNPT